MAGMLELSGFLKKLWMLVALIDKVESIQEQMYKVKREVKILRIKKKCLISKTL